MAKRRQVSVFDREYYIAQTLDGGWLVRRRHGKADELMNYDGLVEHLKMKCDHIAQLQTVVENQKALLKKRNRA